MAEKLIQLRNSDGDTCYPRLMAKDVSDKFSLISDSVAAINNIVAIQMDKIIYLYADISMIIGVAPQSKGLIRCNFDSRVTMVFSASWYTKNASTTASSLSEIGVINSGSDHYIRCLNNRTTAEHGAAETMNHYIINAILTV